MTYEPMPSVVDGTPLSGHPIHLFSHLERLKRHFLLPIVSEIPSFPIVFETKLRYHVLLCGAHGLLQKGDFTVVEDKCVVFSHLLGPVSETFVSVKRS